MTGKLTFISAGAGSGKTHRLTQILHEQLSSGIRIDEALFLGGKEKGAFLKSFGADIFFDDQIRHCDSAAEYVATGHVPYGVKNAG